MRSKFTTYARDPVFSQLDLKAVLFKSATFSNPALKFLALLLAALSLSLTSTSQYGPCNAYRYNSGDGWRWDAANGRWLVTKISSPNDQPQGVVSCDNAAATNTIPASTAKGIYDPSVFTISTSCGAPQTGQEIIWFNFDIQALAGTFGFQIQTGYTWALYYSNVSGPSSVPPAGVTSYPASTSGNCAQLTLYQCMVQTANGWGSITTPSFKQPTNYYLAIWKTYNPATPQLSNYVFESNEGINFKSRHGCGGETCVLQFDKVATQCSENNATYTACATYFGNSGRWNVVDNTNSATSFTVTYYNNLHEVIGSPTTTTTAPVVTLGTVAGAVEMQICATYPAGTAYDIKLVPDATYKPDNDYVQCQTGDENNFKGASPNCCADPQPGAAGSNQTICYNTAPADIVLSNYAGSILRWQKSGDAAFTSPENIEVTSATLTGATIGNLTADTWFRAVVQNGTSCPTATSTAVKITVRDALDATLSGGTTICDNSSTTLTINGNAGAQVVYSINGVNQAAVTLNQSGSYTINTGNLTDNTTYALVSIAYANAPACTTSITDESEVVTIQAAPNAGTDGTITVCAGTTITNDMLFDAITGEDAGGTWTGPVNGVYTYTVNATAPCTGSDVSTVRVTFTPNTICGDYTGDVFANVTSSSAGSATVMLRFTITGDQSADCKSTTGLTASDFSIAYSPTPNNTGVSIGQITYANGVVSAQAIITLPSNTYSATVEFTLQENDPDFVLGSCTEVGLVTVSTVVDGFVTGGGYLLQDGGTIGSRGGTQNNGYKNNFGFNIKYNKAGNKYQGNWNTLFRRNEGGVVHTYQVKSAQASTLTITRISETSYKAEFTFTGGNMKDLTNSSQTIASGLTINVVVYDNGEPGGGVDQMYYEVKSGNTVWYATAGSKALRDLTKGNIQIHVAKTKSAARLSAASDEVDVTATPLSFELKALPNPSTTYFTLQLQSDNTRDKMQLRILDASGRIVENRQNLAPNQTQQVGSAYRPGMYFAELFQGNKKKVVKLIKL